MGTFGTPFQTLPETWVFWTSHILSLIHIYNLNEDGSVRIPAPLRPYMGGKEVITPAK